MSPTKTITVPSTGESKEYDGRIPEALDIRDGQINYTDSEVQQAFEAGQIDDVNRAYLLNVLTENGRNPGVLQNILQYRGRVASGLKPDNNLFLDMQELGLKHHLEVGGSGLDLGALPCPRIDFSGGIIAGGVNMDYAQVRNQANFGGALIDGQLSANYADLGGDFLMPRATVNGPVRMYHMKARDLDWNSSKAGDLVMHDYSRIQGNLTEKGAQVANNLTQLHVDVGGRLEEDGLEVGGRLYRGGMRTELNQRRGTLCKLLENFEGRSPDREGGIITVGGLTLAAGTGANVNLVDRLVAAHVNYPGSQVIRDQYPSYV
ncbi:MAG: hypothetical protein OEY44_04425 [Candidatus Peregrinibacteria bacterium]|nr:hypothetical protein [Candidatus Peregrinibacteria bacterium]